MSASYLDLHLEIDSEGRLRTKPYDTGDDFNFSIQKPLYETWGELGCSGRLGSSCPTCVAPVTKPVISHERGKDGDVLRTSERRV
jgi:hypothetical protein